MVGISGGGGLIYTGALRSDLDRLVTTALIPERERDKPEVAATLRAEWEALKELLPALRERLTSEACVAEAP